MFGQNITLNDTLPLLQRDREPAAFFALHRSRAVLLTALADDQPLQ
jgi:hypothetical protein